MSDENTVRVTSEALLSVGAEVTWCHASSRGRSIGFSTRHGRIIDIDHSRGLACAKTRKSGKLQWLPLHRFRSASARTELTEMVMGEPTNHAPDIGADLQPRHAST